MKPEQHMCVLRATPCFVPAAPVNEAKTTDAVTRVHKGFSGQALGTPEVEPRPRFFQTGGTGKCSGEVFKSGGTGFSIRLGGAAAPR